MQPGSLNLMKFYDEETGVFNVEAFKHAMPAFGRWCLRFRCSWRSSPRKEIASKSYDFRTLGLGYANLGTLLMVLGVPYDSPQGLAIAARIIRHNDRRGIRHIAEMARELGAFPAYERNREHMLRVMRNHRRAAHCRC